MTDDIISAYGAFLSHYPEYLENISTRKGGVLCEKTLCGGCKLDTSTCNMIKYPLTKKNMRIIMAMFPEYFV